MMDLQSSPGNKVDLEYMEVSEPDLRSQEELARRGEELEYAEKEYGIWQSVRMNKMALVYGTNILKASKSIDLLRCSTCRVFLCCCLRMSHPPGISKEMVADNE